MKSPLFGSEIAKKLTMRLFALYLMIAEKPRNNRPRCLILSRFLSRDSITNLIFTETRFQTKIIGMKYGNFHGHEVVVLENGHFRIECLTKAGPRIVRLIPSWMGENVFAEAPDMTFEAPSGEFRYYGGHRLSFAPETLAGTYAPDNDAVDVDERRNGLRIKGPVDPHTHIRKSISIQLTSSEPFVLVKHSLENLSDKPITLAPWAITMMRPGGIGMLPQQYRNIDVDGVLPNRHFALWPYTHWRDRRLRFGEEFITVKAGAPREGMKFGYFNSHGWLGYLFDDVLFVKRFGVRSDATYPDYGCNSEVFSNHRTVELQSLGAVTELAPNRSVTHTETWEVYQEDKIPQDKFGTRSLRERLNQGT